jgi:hypothetical protein
MFGWPSSFIFNTESEELLVLERFGVYKKMRETIGIGMELLDSPDVRAFKRKHKLSGRYLLYAGRIDQGKGCDELVRFFRFYKEERPDAANLQLILIGKLSMNLPQAKDIRYLGFLEEDEKLAAMASASAVVVPSRLESLSIVALEAFSVGTPVLVNAGSKVLVEHCKKANAGLYYADYNEFEQIIDLLLREKNLIRGMGRLGQRYIKENYGWEKLLTKYELAFRSSARVRRPVPRSEQERAEEERKVETDAGVPAGVAPPVEEAVGVVVGDEKLPEESLSPESGSHAAETTVEAERASEDVETPQAVAPDDERAPSEDLSHESAATTSEMDSAAVTAESPPPMEHQAAEAKDSESEVPRLEVDRELREEPPPTEVEGAGEEPPNDEAREEPAEEERPRIVEEEAREETETLFPDGEDKA